MQNNEVEAILHDYKNIAFYEDEVHKYCKSKNYNFIFNKKNGFFARWGKTREEDPLYAPSPEILDCEITTSCSGIPNESGIRSPCTFCYKSNGPKGRNMSLETFKKVLDAFPLTLTQVAFGADAQAKANPDLWAMMDYCREKKIIPNITVADIDDETADKLVSHCGAVSVSRYANADVCYDSVKKLTDRGLKQTNIHCMVSLETFDMCMQTLKDRLTDERLSGLNAIVFLSLKKKGRGERFNSVGPEKFKELVDFAFENKIGIGFDSCSAPKFLSAVKDLPNYKELEIMAEPCESLMFSFYVNVDGKAFACSFAEGCGGWKDGIDMLNVKDFLKDVWYDKTVVKWRKNLINNVDKKSKTRKCPIFEV